MQQPYFLNEAGNKKMKDGIMLWYAGKNPFIKSITGTDVTVHSTYNGEPVTQNYPSLNNAAIALQADPNTEVYVEGTITKMENTLSEKRIVCNNTALTSLYCKTPYLTSIELRENTLLSSIECFDNDSLTSLDLSGNTALTTLDCNECEKLKSIILINNTSLEEINTDYSYYELTSLYLSGNTALTTLNCSSCTGLTSLDLSKNTALTTLNCSSCTGLTSLDLSGNTALTTLDCGSCLGLTSLDLSKNTALTNAQCYSCTGLTSLDLSKNTALTDLDCHSCTGLTSLDLSKNTALTNVQCYSCYSIETIKYVAQNTDVATNIAGLISEAFATDGNVYCKGTYSSTVQTAATSKGWTYHTLE